MAFETYTPISCRCFEPPDEGVFQRRLMTFASDYGSAALRDVLLSIPGVKASWSVPEIPAALRWNILGALARNTTARGGTWEPVKS